MQTLALHRMDDDVLWAELSKIDSHHELRVTTDSSFWLGSVQRGSSQARRFLDLVQAQDCQELATFSDFGADMLYAILVRDAQAETTYHIFVFDLQEGRLEPPRCVWARKLDSVLNIVPKQKANLPAHLEPRISFRSILKKMLFP